MGNGKSSKVVVDQEYEYDDEFFTPRPEICNHYQDELQELKDEMKSNSAEQLYYSTFFRHLLELESDIHDSGCENQRFDIYRHATFAQIIARIREQYDLLVEPVRQRNERTRMRTRSPSRNSTSRSTSKRYGR